MFNNFNIPLKTVNFVLTISYINLKDVAKAMSFSFNLYWIILMTSFDASVLWVGKSLNLVLTLLFVTLVREIYHPDQPDHIS